jgi:hypothetical protein
VGESTCQTDSQAFRLADVQDTTSRSSCVSNAVKLKRLAIVRKLKAFVSSKSSKKNVKIHTPNLWISLWISAVDNLAFSVDKSVDNFFGKKLSTFYPQTYPQAIYLILNKKSDLSTEKRVTHYKFLINI